MAGYRNIRRIISSELYRRGKRKRGSFEQRKWSVLSNELSERRKRERKKERQQRGKKKGEEFADAFYPCPHEARKLFEIFIGLVEVRRYVLAKFYAALRSAGPAIARTTSRKTNERTARSFRRAKRGVNVNERSTRFSRLPANNSSARANLPRASVFSRGTRQTTVACRKYSGWKL